MEAQETVLHILQVQMAVLVKAAFRSLERTDFCHIQQAHLHRRIAQDDLLEDSHSHIQVVALALARIHWSSCQRLPQLLSRPLVSLPFHCQVRSRLCRVRSHLYRVRRVHPFQDRKVHLCRILEVHILLLPYLVNFGN